MVSEAEIGTAILLLHWNMPTSDVPLTNLL
jgi:hypothetical protein